MSSSPWILSAGGSASNGTLFVANLLCKLDGNSQSQLPTSDKCTEEWYLGAAAMLLAIGGWKRWLNRYELWLGAGLLLIPYVTRGHEMCLASAGRFACVAFPCYLVMGQLLGRMGHTAALVLVIAAVLLGTYAALFAAGYGLI